ncbi:MAG: hypothetical protein D6753_16110, partial [Planctomycetota bacterium]
MHGLSIFDSVSAFWVIAQSNAQAQISAGQTGGTADQRMAYIQAIAFIFSIFILPFLISHFVCKMVRMPTHSTRLGIVLATLIAAFLFAWKNDFKLRLGPDMKGGTNLVYDIVPN